MIKIIDNFLPDNAFAEYSNSIKNDIKWRYSNGTAYKLENDQEELGNFFFIYNAAQQKNLIDYIIFSLRQNVALNVKEILRCNANLTLRNKDGFKTDAHVDYRFNHYTLLIYLNETDGDTIIYDKQWTENDLSILDRQQAESLKPIEIISPKPNRCLFFDGRYYHSYFFPKYHNRRIVINMNLRCIVG